MDPQLNTKLSAHEPMGNIRYSNHNTVKTQFFKLGNMDPVTDKQVRFYNTDSR
jgi:hypothetical protein